MASSKYIYYSASTPSSHYAPSNSHGPATRGSLSSPYRVNDAANALEAFADINRALQTQSARQSLPRRVPQGPRQPRAPNPEILPYQPGVPKQEQRVSQDASQFYPPFMHVHTSQGHATVDPRFSIVSSPAVLYPGRPSFPSNNDREIGRYDEYPGYPTKGKTHSTHSPNVEADNAVPPAMGNCQYSSWARENVPGYGISRLTIERSIKLCYYVIYVFISSGL